MELERQRTELHRYRQHRDGLLRRLEEELRRYWRRRRTAAVLLPGRQDERGRKIRHARRLRRRVLEVADPEVLARLQRLLRPDGLRRLGLPRSELHHGGRAQAESRGPLRDADDQELRCPGI